MTNIWRKSLVAVFVCVITFFVWQGVEASDSESKSLTIKNPYTTATVSGEWDGTIEDAEANKPATDTGKEVCFVVNMEFDNTDALGDEFCGEIIKIDYSAKCSMTVDVIGIDVQSEIQAELFASEEMEGKKWEEFDDISWFVAEKIKNTGEEKRLRHASSKAGTQYLVVKSRNTSDVNNVQIRITCYRTQAMELETGKWYVIGSSDYFLPEPSYTFTLDSDAYVTFESKERVMFHIKYKGFGDGKSNVLLEKYDFKRTLNMEKGTYKFIPDSVDTRAGFRLKINVEKPGRVLKENKWKTIYPASDNPAYSYKIVSKQDGYITVTLKDEEGYDRTAKVHMRGKDEGWMSPHMHLNMNKEHLTQQVFAIKKGQTYFLRVDYGTNKIAFKYTFTKVKESSGKSLKNAKTIKKNKQVKGTILGDITSDNEADWYKIKLNKNKKLKITFRGASAKKLKAIIYDKNGKVVKKIKCIADGKEQEVIWKSSKKLSKGNYYIKIYPGTECATGYYSLKWK